jgi:hypothetical protein
LLNAISNEIHENSSYDKVSILGHFFPFYYGCQKFYLMIFFKNTLLKFLLLICFAFAGLLVYAQDSTFRYDLLQYTISSGWSKSLSNNYVAYTIYNNTAKKKYCRMIVYRSEASCGDALADFSNKWKSLVVNEIKSAARSGNKKMFKSENGWLVQQQEFAIDTLKQHRSVLLLSFSNGQRVASVAMVTNDSANKKEMQKLARSIKPVAETPKKNLIKDKQPIRQSQIVRLNARLSTI